MFFILRLRDSAWPADGANPLLGSSGGLLRSSAGVGGTEASTGAAGTVLGPVGSGSGLLPPRLAAESTDGTVGTEGGTGLAGSAVGPEGSRSGLLPGCPAGAQAGADMVSYPVGGSTPTFMKWHAHIIDRYLLDIL